MRAAVCREFGQPLVIEDLKLDPVGPDEVRVEVAACAICHSDIHYADGSWGGALPAVYGHEAAGTVAETGQNVTDVAAGDPVAISLTRYCGDCTQCRRGYEVFCEAGLGPDACKMGSARPRRDIARILAWHRQGAIKLDELVTGVHPLEAINEAIAEVKAGEAIRNVVAMRNLSAE